MASADTGLLQGFLNKVDSSLRRWARRWFILRPDGRLYYFKKECRFEEGEEPCGQIHIESEVVCIIKSDELAASASPLSWPEDSRPDARFAFRVRSGRTYYVYAASAEELAPWIVAFTAIGANITYTDFQLARLIDRTDKEIMAVRQFSERVQQARRVCFPLCFSKCSQQFRLIASCFPPAFLIIALPSPQMERAPSPKLVKKPSVATAINTPPADGYTHRVVGGVVIRTDKN
eukprot:m.261911 g.261911  ORF g.261911 m.261911 type:complete len:233 (+) comp54617_c0_seq1:1732-2430(+)